MLSIQWMNKTAITLATKFVRRFYGERWADPDNYDLVVDTSEVSQEDAVPVFNP